MPNTAPLESRATWLFTFCHNVPSHSQPQPRRRTRTARILKDILNVLEKRREKGRKKKTREIPAAMGPAPRQVTALPGGQRSVHGLRAPPGRHTHQHRRCRGAVHPPGTHGDTARQPGGRTGEGCAFENVPPFTSLMGNLCFLHPPFQF